MQWESGRIISIHNTGIISNLAMISPFGQAFADGENVGELVRWLGHDAVIFPVTVVDLFNGKRRVLI